MIAISKVCLFIYPIHFYHAYYHAYYVINEEFTPGNVIITKTRIIPAFIELIVCLKSF